jgi:hypothetical protein
MRVYKELQQKSLEWLNLRLGTITASNISPIFARRKEGEFASKGLATYIIDKVRELKSNSLPYNEENEAMEWGNRYEDEARKAFERVSGLSVEEVGFVEMEKGIACSPDGFVGDSELVEIKCPFSKKKYDEYNSKGAPETICFKCYTSW